MLEILRRHKRRICIWLAAALLLSAVSALAAMALLQKKQTYTASVNLKFINSAASDDYAYDGTKTEDDIEEVKNTDILTEGIQHVGMEDEVTADEIAPLIKIESIIPDDEQKKIDSALDNGKEYTYNPVEYTITLTTKFPETGKILSGIADAYIGYFVNHHTGLSAMPENVTGTFTDYDYIENAELMDDYTKKMGDYVSDMSSSMDSFRAENGYSYADLEAKYEKITAEDIPELFAVILYNKASKDPSLLLQKLEKEQTDNTAANKDTAEDVEKLEALIRSYSEKNKADQETPDDMSIDENRTNWMDGLDDNNTNPQSTYDSIFSTYNTEQDGIRFNEIQNGYDEYLEGIYKDAEPTTDEGVISEITGLEEKIIGKLDKYYEIVQDMKKESDDVFASSCIRQINTPMAVRAVRVKLYMCLVAAAVFLLMCILQPALHILKRRVKEYLLRQEAEG